MSAEPNRTTAAAAEPWTIGRLLNWTREHFQAKKVDAPRLAAELLLAESLACQKIELYTRFEQVPNADQLTRFRELVKRAAAHEPIAYLLGRREFFSLMFEVTPAVLIPRPETETLVERVLDRCKQREGEKLHLLDMGCGSGCIGTCLAKFERRAQVLMSDISDAALAVAVANASRHGVSDRVSTSASDATDIPTQRRPDGGFHFVVSNPPYIAADQIASLDANVRDYEPHSALIAGDGLDFYRTLASDASNLLCNDGECWIEIGAGQSQQIQSLFDAAGWTHLGTWPDMARIDRVMGFQRRP